MNNINKATCNNNNKDMLHNDVPGNLELLTQTQTQTQNVWSQLDSQPIENVVWGRLYPKNIKVKSLGIRSRVSVQLENASSIIGNTTQIIIIILFSNFILYWMHSQK